MLGQQRAEVPPSWPCMMRSAEGAILCIRAEDPLLTDRMAANWRKAGITPRQKSLRHGARLKHHGIPSRKGGGG